MGKSVKVANLGEKDYQLENFDCCNLFYTSAKKIKEVFLAFLI